MNRHDFWLTADIEGEARERDAEIAAEMAAVRVADMSFADKRAAWADWNCQRVFGYTRQTFRQWIFQEAMT